ncbi:uncharacterized protein RSE6_08401 [Rhynchosporium secalis]|uniref:Uncharacterized protein n=1 Tax=Rhynchosporium secalis TaxID=38038 RepID=A0A1E1MFB9_RHYSE|nr:uncharacterized protein RSE6_08401 [Rhynchosporium secalis]
MARKIRAFNRDSSHEVTAAGGPTGLNRSWKYKTIRLNDTTKFSRGPLITVAVLIKCAEVACISTTSSEPMPNMIEKFDLLSLSS